MGVESRENDPELRDRVQRLLTFLSELVAARSAPVRVVGKHRAVMPLDDGNLQFSLSADAAAGDVVLRARRVQLDDPPRPPERFVAHIDGSIGDSTTEPTLGSTAPGDIDGFDTWLTEWRAWAAVDRDRRPASQLYTFLQRAMLDLEAHPESLELVLASGLLQLSEAVAGDRVRTHLIAQSTHIERHPESGDLLVRLNPDAGPSLEDIQLLTGLDVFDPSSTRTLHESLATQVASPVDPAARVFLKGWAERALTVRVDVVEDASSPHLGTGFNGGVPSATITMTGDRNGTTTFSTNSSGDYSSEYYPESTPTLTAEKWGLSTTGSPGSTTPAHRRPSSPTTPCSRCPRTRNNATSSTGSPATAASWSKARPEPGKPTPSPISSPHSSPVVNECW